MSSAKTISTPIDQSSGPHVLTAWDIPGFVHGFCRRTGGVSAGPFATFNLAGWVGDAPDAVAENWRRWHLLHPHLPVVRVRQVHGNLVHRIDSSPLNSVPLDAVPIDYSRLSFSNDPSQIDAVRNETNADGLRRDAHTSKIGRPVGSEIEVVGPARRSQVGAPASVVQASLVLAGTGLVATASGYWPDGNGAEAVGPAIVGPEGDGMVTAAAGLALAIFTADCVPLLMVDAERRIVAALHAGWRGTLAGIAAVGVHAMVALGARPASIRAALGPSIGLCCFEVDAALAETFAREIPGAAAHAVFGDSLPPETSTSGLQNDAALGVRPGKAHLDLRAILRLQLDREGLDPAAILNVGPCTRCANDFYFSRRGAGGTTSGLQMSFIAFAC